MSTEIGLHIPFREMLVVACLMATYVVCAGGLWWRLTTLDDRQKTHK